MKHILYEYLKQRDRSEVLIHVGNVLLGMEYTVLEKECIQNRKC